MERNSYSYETEDDWFKPGQGIEEIEMDISRHDVGFGQTSPRRNRWVVALLVLSVVIIAIGIGVGVTTGKETVKSSALAPPNTEGSFGPTSTSATEIADVVYASARFGGSEFEDPNSYQSKALAWLMTQSLPASEYPNLSLEQQTLQLYALACIYFSSNAQRNKWTDSRYGQGAAPPGWFSKRGWLVQAGDVCEWYGITCNEDFRVSSLDLDTNGLTGFFPPEVTYLKESLTRLELYNNLIHNAGDEGNAFLGELSNLEHLFLGSTLFENDGIPTQIGRLTKLKELDVSYTLYFGPLVEGMWGGLTDLSYCMLDGNAYGSSLPQDLVTLPNLRYLYASDSVVNGNLNFVASMPNISELWLDQNPTFSGSIPSTIAKAKTLASFSMTNGGLTGTIPSEIGLMTDMIQMWLSGNKLSGTIPSEIGKLTKLKILKVQTNALTGTMPYFVCSRRQPSGVLNELEADCNSTIICPDTCCTCCGECTES